MVTAEALAGLRPAQAAVQVRLALEEAGCPDAAYDAGLLCRLATGRDPRLDERPLTEAAAQKLAGDTARRCQRYPLQYLAGSWEFLDLEFKVGPGVLIPRADTETLCLAAAETLKGKQEPRALDLCSGSGCLALGLCRLVPGTRVMALEKSQEAWPYLNENIRLAAGRGIRGVTPILGDVFSFQQQLEEESFDLILSNPPYLTGPEMEALQPEVRCEPAMALYGGQDGLDFYRHIAQSYRPLLKEGGTMALEVGWQQAAQVARLLAEAGYREIRCARDLEGRDRAVLARRL